MPHHDRLVAARRATLSAEGDDEVLRACARDRAAQAAARRAGWTWWQILHVQLAVELPRRRRAKGDP